MNNINKYRNRFMNLLESTIGDVKPLISEALTSATPTNQAGVTSTDAQEVGELNGVSFYFKPSIDPTNPFMPGQLLVKQKKDTNPAYDYNDINNGVANQFKTYMPQAKPKSLDDAKGILRKIQDGMLRIKQQNRNQPGNYGY